MNNWTKRKVKKMFACDCGGARLIGTSGLVCPDCNSKIVPGGVVIDLETLRRKYPERVIKGCRLAEFEKAMDRLRRIIDG